MTDHASPRRRGRESNEVVVILWRDIPAQVNGQRGRERRQILLSEKFQRAIDRAKRKAGIYTAHDDISQWQRVTTAVNGDAFDAAQTRADELEADYSSVYLGRLAFAGGFIAQMNDESVARADLAALEELDD
ncbi:MAG: virulence factor [Ilumatobacteraceae bacterium]|jgi:hypothetical protein